MPSARPGPGRRRGAGRTLGTTLEPSTTPAARRRAPRPSSPPGRLASSSASRTRTARRRPGRRPCGPPGIDVTVGVEADAVAAQLAPYLTHRRTGRPHVVLKLAATADGRTAAPDGTSQWITGDALAPTPTAAGRERRRARRCRHRAGRRPALDRAPRRGRDPLRGRARRAPPGHGSARLELAGDLGGARRLGGAGRAAGPRRGRGDRRPRLPRRRPRRPYVVYLAPAVFGGDDALGLFRGPAAPTIGALPGGRLTPSVRWATTCAWIW